jgi:hypothetical protein
VRSFYSGGDYRCFTPFLFALVDVDGAVHPCCHLYRDNHGRDRSAKEFRDRHRMGTITEASFADVWNGEAYEAERQKLEVITPEDDFSPCAECTRHCQQNKVLSRALPYMDELLARKLSEKEAEAEQPTWL